MTPTVAVCLLFVTESTDVQELHPQNTLWRSYGRDCITSDVLAVCNAAIEMGIDDILLYDMHFAGCKEYNVQIEKLPSIVRTFD